MDSSSEKIIDLEYIFKIIKENSVRIFLWMFIGGFVSAVISIFFITPKYSSSIDILVNQDRNGNTVQYAEQQADLQAINTYKDILKKSIILETVLSELRKKDNYVGNLSTLKNSVSIDNETNSQVISITAKDSNPYVAKDIANTMGTVFTKKIKKIMNVDNVTVINKATVDTTPISPNKKLNIILGIIIGAVLGIGISVMKSLFDTTVKGTEYLTEELKLTNLGEVSHMSDNNKYYGVVSIKYSGKDDPSQNKKRI